MAPKVAAYLERIGVPEDAPFVPDPFQLEAVEKSAQGDVIVSAPTGSGKTWIAEQAIARELAAGRRCWYASPLKALSNAKFLEFGQRFGEENVGLLTGDHKVNTEAPIIVGTTEILRNQLYDAMSYGRDLLVDLVVADEAHYLGDRDRGVVWEEVLIYLPPRVKLLLLSATVANSEDLAAWLGRERGRDVRVVGGGERPVPLVGICLWPSGQVTDLASAGRARTGRRNPRAFFNIQIPNSKIMSALKELDLLPAIFFLKSRADCDAALSHAGGPSQESRDRFESRRALINEYLEKYPFLGEHPHLGRIRRQAVAAHHAGHLPHYKLLVEDLMSRGLLDAIFATSTVSAGVNFPARTVVIRQSDRFDGQGFSDLTANEFTQMTGRAGRRGRDNIGFVLVAPGPHMDLGLMSALMGSAPDPVLSALTINFSMVLNLLNAYKPSDIRRLLSASLAAWQAAGANVPPGKKPALKDLNRAADDFYQTFTRHLDFLKDEGLVDAKNRLTPDGEWATELRLDHPLVFYAGIKAEAWPASAPALAACVGALVSDKESNQPLPRRKPPVKLTEPLTNLLLAVSPMINRLEDAGFAVPDFNLRPAWALWSWATKGDFDEAVAILGLGAGDMAMLALRAAEHLRQIAGLKRHDKLRRVAYEGIALILKEPIAGTGPAPGPISEPAALVGGGGLDSFPPGVIPPESVEE
ncbi:DEAD/DEAH box helicase [Deltaproteobacteria bacterium OttesenSCG-928-K17]|nr:DEAD/DEAH box helicase [Deltaproteobacteria bacterium OttesenSCG-928-K17]